VAYESEGFVCGIVDRHVAGESGTAPDPTSADATTRGIVEGS
jgi:hypothetical protein